MLTQSAFWLSWLSQSLIYKWAAISDVSESASASLALHCHMSSPPLVVTICSCFITSFFASPHPWLLPLLRSPLLSFLSPSGICQHCAPETCPICGKLESQFSWVCRWGCKPNRLNGLQLKDQELWWTQSGVSSSTGWIWLFSILCKIHVLLTHLKKHIPTLTSLIHTTNQLSPCNLLQLLQ